MRRSFEKVVMELVRDRGHDHSLRQIAVMLHVAKNRGKSIKHLAEALNIPPGSATRCVDRLETQGFVLRLAHSTDRRLVCISLTAKGDEYALSLVSP